jgi:DNA-binding response OmpR family regulator
MIEQKDSVTASGKTRMKPQRILIVDDERTILRFYAEVLAAEGYEVDAAADGEVGWNSLQARPYDLVITDYSMPRLSGTDLFRKIRALGMALPVILATGFSSVNHEGLAFNAILSKPFFASDLIQTVKRVLEQSVED